ALGEACKMIIVHQRADTAGRLVWERIVREQSGHRRLVLQQSRAEVDQPRIALVRPERREPHLPIHARLMWPAEPRPALEVAGLVLELVRLPLRSIHASFDDNF